jgi:hypothetical protein
MPENYQDDPDFFFTFIDADFGTHYVSELSFGGRYGLRSVFSSDSYSSFASSNLKIDVAASFSTLMTGGSSSSMTDSQKEQANAFSEASSRQDKFIVGGNGELPSDGNATTWQLSLQDKPMPMWYKLEGISGLLIPHNFPMINASVLKSKQIALKQGLTAYCAQINESMYEAFDYQIYCEGAPPDPMLPATSRLVEFTLIKIVELSILIQMIILVLQHYNLKQ